MIRRAVQAANNEADTVRGLDMPLLASAGILLFFGLAALYSIDYGTGSSYFKKQILFAVLGIVPFLAFYKVPAEVWHRAATPIYVVNVVLLAAVNVFGKTSGGAQRWLNIGSFQFQPSEFSKIALAFTIAAFYVNRIDDIRRPKTFLMSLLHVGPPILLVFKQPHLGGTLTLIFVWLAVTIVAGVPWRFIFYAFVFFVGLGGVAWNVPGVLTAEQKSRVIGFINPDPKGAGYQQTRALVALGSGGAFGEGYLKGKLKANGSVPEQQTDMILSVVGEEGGLFGVCLLMAGFGFYFYRCWVATFRTTDAFQRLAGAGILASLAFHFYANMGMNLMILPVVGLWLPFISYGGTALWMCMSATGFFSSCK